MENITDKIVNNPNFVNSIKGDSEDEVKSLFQSAKKRREDKIKYELLGQLLQGKVVDVTKSQQLFEALNKEKMEFEQILRLHPEEVAEHIEESKADTVVEKVAGAVKKTLIWTAAVPGQGGIGHINCQPKDYWAAKLEASGLTRNLEKENQLIEFCRQGPYMGWFVNNLIYLERK